MKIQSLAFVLLMIMLFSSAVSGQDERKPNLLIGGVWQTAEDQTQNREYARLLDAEYLPTYYSRTKNPYAALDKTTITGKVLADINTNEASTADAVAKAADVAAVIAATPTIIAIKDPSIPVGIYLPGLETPIMYKPIYTPNDLNGLTNPLISKGPLNSADHYGTIYAHSGGARTAVTALLYQGVTADKLVLISPANGGEDDELNKQELQTLLDSKKVGEIVLYQSIDPKADAAFMNDLWQARFEKSDFSGNFRIEPVTSEQLLGKKGTEGHIQMWYTVLNLELGRDPMSPAPISTEIKEPVNRELSSGASIRTPGQAQLKTFKFKPWGSYQATEFLGESYFVAYVGESNNLYSQSNSKYLLNNQVSKVLIDTDVQMTLAHTAYLPLEEGYKLEIISLENSHARLRLSKNGQVLDETIVNIASHSSDGVGAIEQTYYFKTAIGETTDIIQIAVHFRDAFFGVNDMPLATVYGVFQISDTPTTIT